MKLTGDQLKFLARFSKSPDGRALVSILQAKLGETEVKLRTLEGAELHRQQGRAQQLDELLTDIDEAQARLIRNASTTPPSYRPDAQ